MPPPVSPASSVFNTVGMSVDNPFSLGPDRQAEVIGNSMVMPEAVPQGRTTSKRSKHDYGTNALSQGYMIRLETVPEVSGSMGHGETFSDPYSGGYNGHMQIESSSSSDEMKTESDLLVFPTANSTPDYGSVHKRLKEKSHGRRRDNYGKEAKVISNRLALRNGYGDDEDFERPVKLTREDLSPRQEGKYRRQLARELELAKQKDLLRRKAEEEEQKRRKQREARIARDYREKAAGGSSVMTTAAKYEAQAQMAKEPSTSPKGTQRKRSRDDPEDLLKLFDQITTL